MQELLYLEAKVASGAAQNTEGLQQKKHPLEEVTPIPKLSWGEPRYELGVSTLPEEIYPTAQAAFGEALLARVALAQAKSGEKCGG